MIKILDYTKKPLTLMGEVASVCWDSRPSPQIGIDCIESGHGRVLEYIDVVVEISGYSIKTIRQLYTHIIGVSRLEQSTRYVDCSNFDFTIPNSIKNNPLAYKEYLEFMQYAQNKYEILRNLSIPKEDVANILPAGMCTKMVLKINGRALLHMAEMRLCQRAYWEFRKLIGELLEKIKELDDEWKKVVSYATPRCVSLGYCEEKNSCNLMPAKKEVLDGYYTKIHCKGEK